MDLYGMPQAGRARESVRCCCWLHLHGLDSTRKCLLDSHWCHWGHTQPVPHILLDGPTPAQPLTLSCTHSITYCLAPVFQDGKVTTEELLRSLVLDGAVAEDAVDADVFNVFDR